MFIKLLQEAAGRQDALYILGDLFEAWAGDDDDTPPHPEIISALADFTRAGSSLFIMRGNRDFLLGRNFAAKTGGKLIDDPTVVELGGKKLLLMHGDTLCTGDIKYQIYRRIVNNRFTINLFLTVPFVLRRRIWHGIRGMTRGTAPGKPPSIVDVHQATVEKTMRKYRVHDLIHGHTHRQGVQEFLLDDQKARRYVLGDWYEGDSVLVASENGLRLMGVQEYLKL